MRNKILAGIAVLLVAVGAGVFWPRDRVVEAPPPITETPAEEIILHPEEPDEPVAEPAKEAPWGACGGSKGRTQIEDQSLKAVLASRVDNDPLFGYTARTMEQAECSARRWRLSGL